MSVADTTPDRPPVTAPIEGSPLPAEATIKVARRRSSGARAPAAAYLGHELFLFGLCAFILLGSILLQPSDEAVSLFGWKLPPLCVWQNLFHRECMGCGMTRAFTYMGHGDIIGAFRVHKAGPAFFLLVASQIPLRAWNIWKMKAG